LNDFEKKISCLNLNNKATHQKLLLGSLIDLFSDVNRGQLCIGPSWGNSRRWNVWAIRNFGKYLHISRENNDIRGISGL